MSSKITARSFKAGHIYLYREPEQKKPTIFFCTQGGEEFRLSEVGVPYSCFRGNTKIRHDKAELTDITDRVREITK